MFDADVDIESPIGLVSCSSSHRVDDCDHNNQLFQYWNDYPGWGLATLAPGHSEGCHDVAGMHADRSATDQEYIKYWRIIYIIQNKDVDMLHYENILSTWCPRR